MHTQQSLLECKERQVVYVSCSSHCRSAVSCELHTLDAYANGDDTSLQAIEATLYATLMSISNASGGVSEVLGAALSKILGITAHQFGNMSWLVLICTVSNLLPLPFLNLVPDINEHTALSSIEH